MIIYENYILLSQHFEKPQIAKLNADIVGQKSIGLFSCPENFTSPFFIIKSTLYRLWLSEKNTAEKILQDLIQHAITIFLPKDNSKFIIRSSAKYETFEERGFYKSSDGGVKFSNLYKGILEIWKLNLPNFSRYKDNEFALIIQEYIKPKISGHLSNERRISRNKTEWLIEIVNQKNEFLQNIKFSTNANIDTFSENKIFCNNKKDLIKALKSLALNITAKNERAHIEWVWDGNRLWIVQKDIEKDIDIKGEPGSEWKRSNNITSQRELKSFTTLSTTVNSWKKIKCIRTFKECSLPSGEIYILENENVIKRLSEGIVDSMLKEDLEWLLSYPIVIRMDVQKADGYNNILLPRTETLFTVDQAFDFITSKTKEFTAQGLKEFEFCFLIHRFIISKSCALAFSKPNIQKARIDSTWGIVDGLYYHPHDSFEVNLLNTPPQVKKQIRCKTEYLDVNNSGIWFSKKSGSKWDWAESLTKRQILEIAEYNTKISDHLDSPVTVMYFIDVDQTTGYPSVLPWFYTTEEIADSSEKFTDVIFSEQRELIQNEQDFISLKLKIEEKIISKITLKLKLSPDILRDKVLIESIGEFAKNKNIPIELEGSILSHTYYILRKIGARVKCIDPFEPKYKRQKFYKLVRDKIPINIESKGEKARTVKINSNELLNFLKGKAIEEAYEFYWEKEDDKIIEELADIYEVIRASCKIFDIQIEELEKIADKKNEKKGGFETGVILLDTKESSLIDIVDNSGQSFLIKNNEDDKKQILQKVRKPKVQKISFGIDNSITLPYVIGNWKSEIKDMNAPVNLQEVQSINISYTNRGIKIKFVRQRSQNIQNNQLDMFGNDATNKSL